MSDEINDKNDDGTNVADAVSPSGEIEVLDIKRADSSSGRNGGKGGRNGGRREYKPFPGWLYGVLFVVFDMAAVAALQWGVSQSGTRVQLSSPVVGWGFVSKMWTKGNFVFVLNLLLIGALYLALLMLFNRFWIATPVLLAVDGQAAALFAIRDPLREDSVDALARLHRQGYRLVMLTGDNPTTAKAIAKEAGIDEVIAGVLPDGKADAIKRLQSQGHKVAMVGDGINDAPALAQADVGIAMGGGSDVAIETAAITLMRHSLHGVADALAISKATLRNMKQNLLGAFVYNSLGIPIAAGILWPLTGTLLNPVVAGAAMALSSITVVSNANRLLRFKPKE